MTARGLLRRSDILVIAATALVPIVVADDVYLDLFVMAAFYLLLSASWNVIAGFTGQISFAHMALASVGAYSSALYFHNPEALGLPAGAAFLLAGVTAAVAGALLGLVSLRVRGLYFALITFAFGGAWTIWVAGADGITGGTKGHDAPFLFDDIDLTNTAWVAFGLVLAYWVTQTVLLESRLGLSAAAIRDRESVAEGLGVRTTRVKVTIFMFTAFWAGIAGAFMGSHVGIIAPTLSGLDEMALIASMAIIGGFGSRIGPLLGVIVIRVIDYEVRGIDRASLTTLLVALLTVLVMLFARDGLVGVATGIWRRLRPQARWAEPAHAVALTSSTSDPQPEDNRESSS